jgi:hypothetical protein
VPLDYRLPVLAGKFSRAPHDAQRRCETSVWFPVQSDRGAGPHDNEVASYMHTVDIGPAMLHSTGLTVACVA